MKIYNSPEYLWDPASPAPSIFLAGGITNCPDWQAEMVECLEAEDCNLFNPRRDNFPIHDPDAAGEQIVWEHQHLRKADAILFWFPCETLCPITLYELGAWSMAAKPLFIGTHILYKRSLDVHIQTQLARPEIKIVYSIPALAGQVIDWLHGAKEEAR